MGSCIFQDSEALERIDGYFFDQIWKDRLLCISLRLLRSPSSLYTRPRGHLKDNHYECLVMVVIADGGWTYSAATRVYRLRTFDDL